MIQRIQTVFLLFAILSLGLFLWMPVITFDPPNLRFPMQGYDVGHFFDGYIYLINLILTGTAVGLTLINIFLFKYRSLQMLICWFSILLVAAGEAFVYYKYLTQIFTGDVILTWWNALSIVAIVFEVLAFAYIRKDEETIKSLDRLR